MEIDKDFEQKMNAMGGYLECSQCKSSRPARNILHQMANGWDKCCGYTMHWITQKMIDEKQAYGTDCRGGTCE